MTESPVPLDIIGQEEFLRQGSTDLKSLMSTVTPSFNVNDQPINDASSLVRPANLRGLASDHTLVLVNGKRRHRSAVITFLGGGLSDGSQGPDISTIPVSALKQVEVLRDGAAAQYGSDAIAGVINFALKDASEGGSLEARYGSYFEGDGDTFQVTGNIGLPMSDDGFANFSMEYREADDTSRSVQRSDAAQLTADGNAAVLNPAQIWGSPEIKYDFKVLGNFGLDMGNDKSAYLTLNYAEREIDGGFYFRNPHTRGGVNDGGFEAADVNGDGIIGTDDDGEPNEGYSLLLVGDLTDDMSGNCPMNIRTGEVIDGNGSTAGYNVLTDPNYIAGVAQSPECFAFNELLPGGFTPRFGGLVTDMSMIIGTDGELDNGWRYDLSATLGYSEVEFSIYNTVNPSMGPDTPFEFSPGAYRQLEQTVNYDMAKQFDVEGWDEPVNVAWGVEYRHETFEIDNGDPASFEVGPLASQGFGIGSNGFPGFKPQDAGSWSRHNWAAYVDVETYLNEDWLVTGAVRFEDFSDFGSTSNAKVSTHYQVNDTFGIRSALSTGFRAPTVGQSNVRNVTTAFAPGGLEDQATLPPTNPISVQKGGKALEPEESVNFSLGFVAEFESGVYLTADYFRIELTDRISQTSALDLTQADIDVLLSQGQRDATSFSSVKYFTNDFDTTTQGVDIVANYATEAFGGDIKYTLAYNWTDTTVDSFSSNINLAKVEMLEDNLPAHRANASATYMVEDFDILARINYYGKYYEDHLDAGGDLPIYAGSEVTVDVEFTYHFDEQISVSLGAQNLFDNRPDNNPWDFVVGSQYPATSPMGINGGFYYLRANYAF